MKIILVMLISFTAFSLPFTKISAVAKTDDVISVADAADDIAIYVNENQPERSLIIGTDKEVGLLIHDLSGRRVQSFLDGKLNNVDLRPGFRMAHQQQPLIAASNRSTNTIDLYYVDTATNSVKKLSNNQHNPGLSIYGICMYKSPRDNNFYIFVTSKKGEIIQWRIDTNGDDITLFHSRSLKLASVVEACVADDMQGKIYFSEEGLGIWQFGAEQNDGDQKKLIDHTGAYGHLVADVEGLAIYATNNHEGYLLASSQGESAYNIYSRKDGRFIAKFGIEYHGVPVQNTDGIDVTSSSLGRQFPSGLLVVQDGNKDQEKQNFKYISWDSLSTILHPKPAYIRKDPRRCQLAPVALF